MNAARTAKGSAKTLWASLISPATTFSVPAGEVLVADDATALGMARESTPVACEGLVLTRRAAEKKKKKKDETIREVAPSITLKKELIF